MRPSVVYVPAAADGIARIVIDREDDRVNAIDERMMEGLAAAVAAAKTDRPRAVVLLSAKPDQFIGGADLNFVRSASETDIRTASETIQRILADLAGLPAVSVAAIGGAALGGGCEVALACDWRIAADAPAVRIGQVEIRAGLLPAGGGTQRLPRLVGLPRALDLILGSRQLGARHALRAGLVDEVVHPASLERAAVDRALRAGKREVRGGRTPLERAVTWLPPLRAYALRRARAQVAQQTRGHYPAPYRAIEAIATGLATGMPQGQAAEARAFGELAAGDVARSLIHLLFLTLGQRRAALRGLGTPREVRQLGVVGAGFMGAGIAQSAAVAGITVRLRDVDAAAVARGIASAAKLTRDAAQKGIIDRREAPRVVARLSGGGDLTGFARAQVVVEAVFEDLAVKRKVIAELEAALPADAVIATNTSALPIAEIAAGARHPERIVGMHFFSPVHRMPLVEVVRPPGASPDAVATVVALASAMGKIPIVVSDGPGFYTTRVISALSADAFALLAEGARVDLVDAAMTAFGWPVGPFALADEVGLAVALHAGLTMARLRGGAAPAVLAAMVAEGMQGKRNGKGFYLYRPEGGRARGGGTSRRVPNPRVHELAGVAARPAPADTALRLTRAFVDEALRCLEEGILRSADEGDLGAVLGLGFPPFLGGPFRYAAARGIARTTPAA